MARTLNEGRLQPQSSATYHRRQQQPRNQLRTTRNQQTNNSIPGYINPMDVFPNVERVHHHYNTSSVLRMLRLERFSHLERIRRNTYATCRQFRLRFDRFAGRMIQVEREIHVFHPFEEDILILRPKKYNIPIVVFLTNRDDGNDNDIIRFETVTRPPNIISSLFERITANARRLQNNEFDRITVPCNEHQVGERGHNQCSRRILMPPHD
jgi:hypothetical protein